jgi:hypothetical protein
MCIDARQQHGLRWRAARVRVKIGEAENIACQRGEVDRLDLAAKRIHVSKYHVIAYGNDDVRFATWVGVLSACNVVAVVLTATPISTHPTAAHFLAFLFMVYFLLHCIPP